MTKIEWVKNSDGTQGKTWNPVTGCTKVSPGCKHCYAERMSKRLAGRAGYPADEPFRVTLHRDRLDEPLRWKKPQTVFVVSMGDLFHDDVPDSYIDRVWLTMSLTPRHTYQVLTKRPERMKTYISEAIKLPTWPLPNVWLGVTAENQEQADKRIPLLLQTPAAVRFVSVEPMLGPVELLSNDYLGSCINCESYIDYPEKCTNCNPNPRVDWVVCGGETGPGARPIYPDWVRGLRDQCQDADVSFFFKSWGEHCYPEQMSRFGKKAADAMLDGREWREMPNRRAEHE